LRDPVVGADGFGGPSALFVDDSVLRVHLGQIPRVRTSRPDVVTARVVRQ